MKKGIIIFLLLIIVVYFTTKFLLFFSNFSPIMNNVFDNGTNLEENQSLIKENLILKKIDNNEPFLLDFNSKDTIILYFFNLKYERKSIEDYKGLYKIYKKKNYIIFTDSLKYNIGINKNYYYIKKDSIPFKYNNLMYPYKVTIYKNKIIKSEFTNL